MQQGCPMSEVLEKPGVYWVLHCRSQGHIIWIEVLPQNEHTTRFRYAKIIVDKDQSRELGLDVPEWKESWIAFDNYWFAYAASIKWKAEHAGSEGIT